MCLQSPYVMARWPPQQIPSINFLGSAQYRIWNVITSLLKVGSSLPPVEIIILEHVVRWVFCAKLRRNLVIVPINLPSSDSHAR